MKIGFVGLGIMGRPMASNLRSAGNELLVHNRSSPPVDALVAAGASSAATPSEVASGVDVLFMCLPDSPDVEAVLYGDAGIFEGAKDGLLIIDTSTISPAAALRFGEEARGRGLRFVDAPVSGGEQGAIDGVLAVMVGGDDVDVAAARPYLDSVGSTVVHVGPLGSGQTVKAANQMLVAGTIQLVSEALVLLEANGVDTEPAFRVLAAGLAGNQIIVRKGEGMRQRNFQPGFRVDLHHKDLGIAMEAVRAAGTAAPLTAMVAQLMGSLRSSKRESLDHTALLELVDELSGRTGVPDGSRFA